MSYLAPAPAPSRARLFLTCSVLAWLGAGLWTWLLFAGPLPAFDAACARFWHEHDRPHSWLWEIMVLLTDLGGIAAVGLLTGMGALWQWSLGRRRLALAWLAIATGGGLIDLALKETFDRPRPPAELRDVAVLQSNESYPSGHALSSTIAYGMLAYALRRGAPRPGRRGLTALLLGLLVLGIGLSRVYLRAHWFSDVIGGFLVGAGWLCLGLAWLEHGRPARAP